jgi:tetratricopeptide (TPR) repeat protein
MEVNMSELEFWKDLGNIFDAVLNYQKKNVEFNNRFINPWIRLGNIFERQDKVNDAVQAYQRATEIDPDTSQNWVDLGDAQFKNGEYDEAIEAYRKAVILDPEAGWPLGNLALTLVTQGKIEEAIPLYKKSIDLLIEIEDKAICWNRLGNAYRKLNDYESAFFAFQKADQLDGENTGFSDKLDETPSSTSLVAPEEILDQMTVEQSPDQIEAESTALTVTDEPVEATPQPEFETIVIDSAQMETVDEPIALGPNIAMVIEDSATEEDTALPLNETSVEEPTDEVNMAEEESPLNLHEKKFDLLQAVENVITKVERAYAEQKFAAALEDQVAEEVSAEVETGLTVISEEAVALEVEAPVISIEEGTKEVEPVTADLDEPVELKVETPVAIELSAEESISEEAPRRFPAWLVIHDAGKEEEKLSIAKNKVKPEPAQIESVTMLSGISQETAISNSVLNMDIVETYTDALVPKSMTEPSLSKESIPEEATDQIEGHVATEAQEKIEADESNPVEETAIAKETSTIAVEEQATESAYEEYLKDMAGPVSALTDYVDNIHDEAPVTKVSKNGEVRIVMDTKNAHVWNELGNIYLNAGTCDAAITSYSKAIELDRNFAWPYSNLALAYVQKGRFAEAILLYQRGIELFTSDRDKAITWNRLGNVYRRINDYSNAIASYQTADELDPENATLSLRSSFGLLGNKYSDSKPAYVT